MSPAETASGPSGLPGHLLLFDGVCNLCNGLVRFIIRHDRRQLFRFAPLQSRTASLLRPAQAADPRAPASLVYYRKGKMLLRSTAALYVARDLGSPWCAAYALILVPRFLRDAAYDLIARKRYRWFGRREQCMVPAAGLQERFLS